MTLEPVRRKWRPTLGMVVFGLVLTVLVLPFAGLNFFRLFENELVRQTESELIAQSAALAAVYAREVERKLPEGIELGAVQPEDAMVTVGERYQPILPKLDLSGYEIRERRPAAEPKEGWPAKAYLDIGKRLSRLTAETQKHTLAGFRILDPKGRIIAGRAISGQDGVGLSLAHIEEVQKALEGSYESVLRLRVSDQPPPPVYALSRGTKVRVFTALPVIVEGKVAGVVYASRTPSNIVKYLYGERRNLVLAALSIIAAASIVGFVVLRTITRPVKELSRRAQAIGQGDRAAISPLDHYGTKEIANLSQGFFRMAQSLFDRSDFVSNFAAHVSHELKSPLTSIIGAAELLRDSGSSMTEKERSKFLDNIVSDTERLSGLLERLRELARADNPQTKGAVSIEKAIEGLRGKFWDLDIYVEGNGEEMIAMSQENAAIVFSHLFDNAQRHHAGAVKVQVAEGNGEVTVTVSDDGEGISEQNRAKIFETFFTTRRESGGTGMGLRIVRSMLSAHGGSIQLLSANEGTAFELWIPGAEA